MAAAAAAVLHSSLKEPSPTATATTAAADAAATQFLTMHFCSCSHHISVCVCLYVLPSLSISLRVCVCCINKYTQNSPAQKWALLSILIFITVTSISTSRSCHKKQTQQQKVARREGGVRAEGAEGVPAKHYQISCNFGEYILCRVFARLL